MEKRKRNPSPLKQAQQWKLAKSLYVSEKWGFRKERASPECQRMYAWAFDQSFKEKEKKENYVIHKNQ